MNLQEFFRVYPKVALGFSGGVDSAYLLYAACTCGAEIRPYFVKSQFQPEFELEDARRLTEEMGLPLTVIDCDVLSSAVICDNPQNRCYHCKNMIFGKLMEQAEKDGFDTIIDGTNASDDADDRPGMMALAEMKVLSPLRLCGMTKDRVRVLSREAGLFTWDKPAYACLATRMPCGEKITAEKLTRIEGAEATLISMGYSDFRVRYFHGAARLQFKPAQLEQAAAQRREIRTGLKPYFDTVLIDLEER